MPGIPNVFGSDPGGNYPASQLDANFNYVGSTVNVLTSVSGTNAITGTSTITLTAYAIGQRLDWVQPLTNTGAATLNVGGIGIGAIQAGGFALLGDEMRGGSWQTAICSQVSPPLFQLVTASVPSIPAGTVADFGGTSAPSGWLECDWSQHDPAVLPALYAAIGTTWNRGDETAGWFRIPPSSGRGRIGRGTGTTVETVTASSSNGFTVASNNTKWITGMPVVLSALTGFTTSATAGPTYYAVRISATNVRLATTLALAQNLTPNVTISGTGTATLTTTFTARTVGELGGEEGHAQSITELLAHMHNTHPQDSATSANTSVRGSVAGTNGTVATDSTGGNAAMNIMQLFGVYMTVIKT
ncbi:MAG: phage tail protein [Candidatus Acidiferrales bacterium]